MSQPARSKIESQALFLPSLAGGQAFKEAFRIVGFLFAATACAQSNAMQTKHSPPSNILFTVFLQAEAASKKSRYLMPVVDFLKQDMQVR